MPELKNIPKLDQHENKIFKKIKAKKEVKSAMLRN